MGALLEAGVSHVDQVRGGMREGEERGERGARGAREGGREGREGGREGGGGATDESGRLP